MQKCLIRKQKSAYIVSVLCSFEVQTIIRKFTLGSRVNIQYILDLPLTVSNQPNVETLKII